MRIGGLRGLTVSGANRIALSTALRGTIATVVPLVAMPMLGVGLPVARFAVIGALQTSMVDVGGSYRSRMLGMAANAVVAPLLIMLGAELGREWWLAGLAMLLIAVAGGLIRTLGAGGASFGLISSVAFLIGLQLPGGAWAEELELATGYAAGALWTLLVALAFWQFRPYRRLEQEVAGAWEAVGALVAAARPRHGSDRSVVARRRHEQLITARHRATREAIERARTALGELRQDTDGSESAMAQLLVLIRAASRISAAILALDEIEEPVTVHHGSSRAMLTDGVAEIEKACHAIAKLLLTHRGELDFTPARDRLSGLATLAERARFNEPSATARILEAQVIAMAQAVRHLDGAAEAMEVLMDHPHRGPRLTRLALEGSGPREALAAIRAQFTPESAVFRHAVRVAVVAAIGTAAIMFFDLPHGIWLPMTALVILQPDYGATMSRALQRTAGTVAGAVLAGLLIATVHGTVMFEIAIAALLFATFLLLRRRYGWAITFLTPLIILLLGLSGPGSWLDVGYRIIDTLAGAGLAIVAGYALWPRWQREDLASRLAQAIAADKAYAAAVLDALAVGTSATRGLAELRRRAEIEAANAEAAFQRMLAEPRHQRGRIPPAFALTTYIQRLARHSIALAGYVGAEAVPKDAAGRLRELLEAALEDVASALVESRHPRPRPNFDEPLEQIRSALTGSGSGVGATVAFLVGQLVADTSTLHSALMIK